MKVKVKRNKRSASVQFAAGKNEGVDLRDAVFAAEGDPVGVIVKLQQKGYVTSIVDRSENALNATLVKPSQESGAIPSPTTKRARSKTKKGHP